MGSLDDVGGRPVADRHALSGMLRLTLVRHARAHPARPGLDDFDRPLDEVGTDEASVLASRLARRQLPEPRIRASDALRCLGTARILAEGLSLPDSAVVTATEAYLASAGTLLELLRSTPDDCSHLLLCGHNPGLSQLVALMTSTPHRRELPTAGAASLLLDDKRWSDVNPGSARLDFLETPQPAD